MRAGPQRAGRQVFPLLARRRLVGSPFGTQRSLRRGAGSEVAGSRPYVPGDPVATIDWHASARLSTARGSDEFIVRERYAEEAPLVVVVADRRPSMSLFPPPFPWLSKPAAAAEAVEAIAASAAAAGAELSYLDEGDGRGRPPYWLPPGGRDRRRLIVVHSEGSRFDAPEDTLLRSFDYLSRLRAELPAGTFVFVLSDFVAPPPRRCWLRAVGHGWDVVPVVIQDPLWEQSFPELEAGVVPVADPATGRVFSVRLSLRQARRRKALHEERLRTLVRELARLGCDPVVLSTSEPGEIDRAFLAWAERRRRVRP